MPRTVLRAATAALLIFAPVANGFALSPSRTLPAPPSSRSSSRRLSNNDDSSGSGSGSNDAQQLKEKANRYRKEADKLRLALELKKIDELQSDLKDFAKLKQQRQGEGFDDDVGSSSNNSNNDNNNDAKKLNQFQSRVADLVRGSSVVGNEEADKLLAGIDVDVDVDVASFSSDALPTQSNDESSQFQFTEREIKAAMSLVEALSKPTRETLAITAGYRTYREATADERAFLRKLYQSKDKSTTALRRTYAQTLMDDPDATVIFVDESYSIQDMADILASDLQERMEGNRAMELFPRSVQDMDDELLPTQEDAEAVFRLLDRTTFMATEKPIRVNGGYLIRGENKRNTASEFIAALETKIAKEIPQFTEAFQFNFVEITADPNSDEFIEDSILITSNQFPVRAPIGLGIIATALSCFYTFVYAINVFSGNPVVMERLKEANEKAASMAAAGVGAGAGGVPYDLTWFNELLLPLLGTLAVIQGVHELGHLTVAWANKIKLSAPVILPSKGLPYLSFQNRLKTSPKDYTALFDLAAAGPLTGLTVSFLALLVGLQLTTTVDPSTAQLLPSLSVGFLCQSSLGGTLVDMVLGGGDGILINQEAATMVPLHPIAVAGFFGMFINALDLLPIGSTDGGRMSQAALGRVWHLTFSSVIFFVLFAASFVSDAQDIFLGYLFLYSFTQRDLEIPCRNEVDKVELPRVIAAVVSWAIAALILVPLR